MDERRLTVRHLRSPAAACAVLLVGLLSASSLHGEVYRDPCDSSKVSWQPSYDQSRVRVSRHQRNGYEFHSGTAAEEVQFTATGADSSGTYVRLSHAAPSSLVIDELTASVWYRSNRAGATLAVRIVLPHEVDPQTNAPVEFDLHGEKYAKLQQWQQLTCQTHSDAIEQQLKLVRNRLARVRDGRPLDTRQMYVSGVAVKVPAARGKTGLLLDELSLEPIVRAPEQEIRGVEGISPNPRPDSPIRIETNRLLVEGKPFFPRIVRYLDEQLGTLDEVGVNVAWIDHYDDQILMDALAQRGIWSMATPPQAAAGDNGIVQAAGMVPIPATTSSLLFWSVGTRVPPQDLRHTEAWIDQLRDADRAFSSPRPVLADVMGDERRFSRYVSLLGTSRHILHTTVSPLQYRDYLDHRQRLALPDRFKWSWIQTEPSDGNIVTRSPSLEGPVTVEAEQIWLQAWTGICVGHKALGFWTFESLDETTPATNERRLALSLLNAQIDLLEPWLAAGKVVDKTVPVAVTLQQSPDLGRRGYGFRNGVTSRHERDALLRERQRERARAGRVSSEVQATVIESSYGRLVIPVWYEQDAQFQPGQMAAQDVSIVVRNVEDAHPWLVSTTAVTPLEKNRVPGGIQINLPMIDQHAFVVITADPRLSDELTHRMRSMRRRCGQLWVELAGVKLDRVKETHAAIEATAAPRVPDAPFLLSSATSMLEQARQHLRDEHYADAERFSRYVMQLLRKLQRAHWENAVARLTAPTSSPHAVCFNTLPDHWRLMADINRNNDDLGSNLLRSGNFEDLDTVKVDGWKQMRTAVADPQRKIAELHADAASGKLCLRLRSSSARGAPPPTHIGPDVVVTSPQIPIRGGQTVLISGQVRIDRIDTDNIDGLMVYDNVNGTVGALRWQRDSRGGAWETFQLIRQVHASRDLQLTFELHGEGDVRLDDVKVVALSTGRPGERSAEESAPGNRRSLLDFAPSLPKVRLWPGRKSEEVPAEATQPAP